MASTGRHNKNYENLVDLKWQLSVLDFKFDEPHQLLCLGRFKLTWRKYRNKYDSFDLSARSSVEPHHIYLEKIERKEFFHALIRIDNIQAIEVQFREYRERQQLQFAYGIL